MKQGKSSWPLIKLLMGIMLLLVLFSVPGYTEAEMDKKYWGIWKDRIDEKDPDFGSPSTAPAYLRKGAKKEITDLRDELENEFRMYLLALYWDEKKIEKIKSILNKPWNKEGIEFLWADIFEDTYDSFKREMLINLLVYVDAKYKDETIRKTIRDKMNGLFEKMIKDLDSGKREKKTGFWNSLNRSIAKYGSLELVSPAMWKYVEKSGRLSPVLEIFESHPSKEGVDQLKTIAKDISWKEDDKRRGKIQETIKLVESLLRYPVVKILMAYHKDYAKVIIRQADEMKGTQEERLRFLEQEIDKYADSRVKAAQDPNLSKDEREKEIKEAQEIKTKLKEFKEKNQSK